MKDSDWLILSELYKNPNLTKVAELLYTTQPSLTKRIRHIEEEFGVTIVSRLPKGLRFTPEGEYLGRQADIYLSFLDETKREIVRMKGDGERVINIGSSYTFSKYDLGELMMGFRRLHPKGGATACSAVCSTALWIWRSSAETMMALSTKSLSGKTTPMS